MGTLLKDCHRDSDHPEYADLQAYKRFKTANATPKYFAQAKKLGLNKHLKLSKTKNILIFDNSAYLCLIKGVWRMKNSSNFFRMKNFEDFYNQFSATQTQTQTELELETPPTHLHFGKYRNIPISEIATRDPQYLDWALDKLTKISPELKSTIAHHLRSSLEIHPGEIPGDSAPRPCPHRMIVGGITKLCSCSTGDRNQCAQIAADYARRFLDKNTTKSRVLEYKLTMCPQPAGRRPPAHDFLR